MQQNNPLLDQLNRPSPGLDKRILPAAMEIATAHAPASFSWFNPASTPEHQFIGKPAGKGAAIDFMVYANTNLGNQIAEYAWTNRVRLGIKWLIWNKRIRSTSPGHDGEWHPYSGPSPHTDHVHINFGRLVGFDGYSSVPVVKYVPVHKPWSGVLYVTKNGTKGFGKNGKVKHTRKAGFKIRGTVSNDPFNGDGRYFVTKFGTYYALDSKAFPLSHDKV